jgi:nitrous oxide reductase
MLERKIRELRKGKNKLRAEKGKECTKKLRTLTPNKPIGQKDTREFYKSRKNDHPVEEEEYDRTVEEEKNDHTVQKNVCNDSEHEDEILTKQDENNIDEKSEHFVRNDHDVDVRNDPHVEVENEGEILTKKDEHTVNEKNGHNVRNYHHVIIIWKRVWHKNY